MTDASLLAFTALAALLVVTPGADTLVLFRNALRGGRRAAVATALGGRCGLLLHATAALVGVAALLARSALAFEVLRWVGAGYLLWLGSRSVAAAWTGRPAATAAQASVPQAAGSWRRPWREGFLTNALNPKTAVFYLAVLPQFLQPGEPVLARSALLCAIHFSLSLVWYLSLAWLFHSARAWLTRPAVRRTLDALSGSFLLALSLKLVFQQGG